MGLNAAQVKLSAFAFGAALAGLAGALYAASLNQTGGPDSYTFNRSITVLCFLIIGGMGNLRGAIAGTFILMGYDISSRPGSTRPSRTAARSGIQHLQARHLRPRAHPHDALPPRGLLPSRRAEEDAAG